MNQTKYSQVKGWIKSKILDGTYVSKQKINSESELMKQFSVSRHTVRQAIGELVSEGWLYREQGSGTFCSDRTERNDMSLTTYKKRIAIITTYISDYIFPSIIRGAEEVISKAGYQVSLFSTNNDYEQEREILKTVISQNFDGAIIEPTKSASSSPNLQYYLNLEALNIPYIMINAHYDELEQVNIIMDDEKGGYLQAQHLINLDHRDILIFFKNDDMQGVRRLKGCIKAFRDYKIPVDPNRILGYSTQEKMTKPVEYLKQILQSDIRPTGIVCYNDELVLNLLDVFRERNMVIPDDMSIIGFDDSFLAKISEVKLTTIEHPQTALGKRAAQMVLHMVADKNKRQWHKTESYIFEPKLIVRNSTKAIQVDKREHI